MKRILAIIFLTVSAAVSIYAQQRFSAGIRSGYPFSPQEEMLEGENSLGRPLKISAAADIQYAFVLPESYQGIGVSVFSLFDHKDTGTPFSIYVFQSATIAQLSPMLSLDYEWNFGASFGWHSYDESPFNTIMGSKVNAYINGSIMLTWQVSKDWKIAVGPDMTHFSNGHTDIPNAGLNTIGLRLDVARTFGNKIISEPEESITEDRDWKKKISIDLTMYGALKKFAWRHEDETYIADGRFGVGGLHINPFYDFDRHFRAGVSLDMNFDESANIMDHVAGVSPEKEIKFYRPSFSEQSAIGLSVRAELVMPVFSVHFGIGHNLIYKGDDFKGFYQILALKTHITRRLYIHTGYQFRDFNNPDNLLIGLGWRFGNTGR